MRIYQLLFIILLFFTVTGCISPSKDNADKDATARTVSSGPAVTEENNKKAKEVYDKALQKWNMHDITSYSMKVEYGAFSPSSGVWEITVKNGEVSSCKFIGSEKADMEQAGNTGMTMDFFFDLATGSYQNTPDALFLMTAQFDEELGYVKLIQTRSNPAKKGRAPTDRTYKYEIIEFIYE